MRLTRRNFLTGSAALAAASSLPSLTQAAPAPTVLRVVKRTLEVNGRAASVFGIQQPDGKSGLTTIHKAPFSVRLENQIADETLVHWHGLTPPSDQDGVPALSQPLLPPGAAYEYDFPLQRAGTFWMHSHYGLQEQGLLAAPLIVHDPIDFFDGATDVVVMLHDFTFRDPQEIYAELTGGGTAMDHSKMDMSQSSGTGEGGMAGMGHSAMEMGHLNDVEFDAYLANDRTLNDPEVVTVEAYRSVRLRIINGSASTNFWIDVGGLDGFLLAVDGSECIGAAGGAPPRRRFPLAMSQRVDIWLTSLAPGAYPILAQREGDVAQTGIILATPGASIARVATRAQQAAPPLTLHIERGVVPRTPLVPRAAGRRHTLNLTGNMMGFVWSLNGRKFGAHEPLAVRRGERVEIEMVNRTDMSHPMHLHGHTFQVVEIDGQRINGPMRDTVLVPVNGRVAIAFDADNPGRWALHCHNLYHMAAGMMTTVEYEA
jgi:FtsP/CotA-like multicopper oxidase with cupredoxin domain